VLWNPKMPRFVPRAKAKGTEYRKSRNTCSDVGVAYRGRVLGEVGAVRGKVKGID
jgi:hypothetical protein